MNTRLLLCIFFRTYLVGAGCNTRGLQNIGISFVMDPGLQAIYQGKELQKARKRYLVLYNTHPFWTPMQAGIFLFLEQRIASGLISKKTLSHVRTTVAYTLSAIGDSFFSGSFFIFWSLLSVFFIHYSFYLALFIFWTICFLGLQALKFYTFYLGVNRGLESLQYLHRWDLINYGQYLKYINACLIPVLWFVFFPLNTQWPVVLACGLGVGMFVWLIHTFSGMREIFLLCILLFLGEQERIFKLLEVVSG